MRRQCNGCGKGFDAHKLVEHEHACLAQQQHQVLQEDNDHELSQLQATQSPRPVQRRQSQLSMQAGVVESQELRDDTTSASTPRNASSLQQPPQVVQAQDAQEEGKEEQPELPELDADAAKIIRFLKTGTDEIIELKEQQRRDQLELKKANVDKNALRRHLEYELRRHQRALHELKSERAVAQVEL